MKKSTIAFLFLVFAGEAFSGGSVGGNPPSVMDLDSLALMSLSIDQLPKVFADQEEFRRANARLSVVGTETASLNVEGQTIQVRKLRDSIVDEKISKEILPQ